MARPDKPVIIVMADDDPDDLLLTEDALREADISSNFRTVTDGEDLISYLKRTDGYSERNAPRPDLILLDINMPKMNGHEVLTRLQADEALREIPVVIITTSGDPEDVRLAYRSGARSYVQKPRTFGELVDAMMTIGQYWFRTVELPPNPDADTSGFRLPS